MKFQTSILLIRFLSFATLRLQAMKKGGEKGKEEKGEKLSKKEREKQEQEFLNKEIKKRSLRVNILALIFF